METAFIILIIIHGYFHFLAFLKAFNLVNFKNFQFQINKTHGIAFLIVFVMLALLILLYSYWSTNWWWFGFVAFGISQPLIFRYWATAKYGTIANVILLWVSILAFLKHYLLW